VTLQDLGSIGEVLGALGVIISLIYLAVQIRQNTRSLRASSRQAVLDGQSNFATLLLHNDNMARVYRVGIEDIGKLTDDERVQLDALLVTMFRSFQNLYFEHESSTVEQGIWDGFHRNMLWHMKRPGVREWWETRKVLYSPAFSAFLDGRGE
jgi:hypothetical protein